MAYTKNWCLLRDRQATANKRAAKNNSKQNQNFKDLFIKNKLTNKYMNVFYFEKE